MIWLLVIELRSIGSLYDDVSVLPGDGGVIDAFDKVGLPCCNSSAIIICRDFFFFFLPHPLSLSSFFS